MNDRRRSAATLCILVALGNVGCGGSVQIFLEDEGQREGLAGSQFQFTGTFETTGVYNGRYTLTTEAEDTLEFCRVAVGDEGGEDTRVAVDTTEQQTIDVKLDLAVKPDATDLVACTLRATKDDDEDKVASHAALITILDETP